MASYDATVPTSVVISNISQSTITAYTQLQILQALLGNAGVTTNVAVYTQPVIYPQYLNGTNIAIVETGEC